MDVNGLAVVLLLAQATATLAASREYHLVTEKKTWEDARSYCRENFADLATIETQADHAEVAQIIPSSGSGYVWIGSYDDVDTWRWTLDNTSLNDDAYLFFPADFVSFNNGNGQQYCAFLARNRVDDLKCDETLPSLCYDKSSDSNVRISDLLSWQSARSRCRQEYTDLAILRNLQELEAARNMLSSNDERMWIGLVRENWKWSDQTNLSYSNWENGQPNEPHDCGATSVNGWNDYDCSALLPFICSVPIRTVLKVEIKTNDHVDLNDPLVQEVILRQLEKDMKARGIKQDIKLRWREQPTGNIFN